MVELGLIDEPVVVVRLSGLFVQEHDGSSHDAWYGGRDDARIVCPRQESGPLEVVGMKRASTLVLALTLGFSSVLGGCNTAGKVKI